MRTDVQLESNLFRFTVDQETGIAVIGDVGLNAQEEIDLLFQPLLCLLFLMAGI